MLNNSWDSDQNSGHFAEDIFKYILLHGNIWILIKKKQSWWDRHGAHLGPVGPRWVPCWPHEPCYQGRLLETTITQITDVSLCLNALNNIDGRLCQQSRKASGLVAEVTQGETICCFLPMGNVPLDKLGIMPGQTQSMTNLPAISDTSYLNVSYRGFT